MIPRYQQPARPQATTQQQVSSKANGKASTRTAEGRKAVSTENMLRVRSLATQGVRDFARREIGRSSAAAAVRELTYYSSSSSSSHPPATLTSKHGEAAAAARTTARVDIAPVQHGMKNVVRAVVVDEAEEHQEDEEEEGGGSPEQGDVSVPGEASISCSVNTEPEISPRLIAANMIEDSGLTRANCCASSVTLGLPHVNV